MFTKSRKDKLVDEAQSLAQDLSDAIAPHLERAKDELAPRLSEARESVAPHVEHARDRLVNDVVPSVQKAVNEAVENAREQAAPIAEEAKRRSTLAVAAAKGEPVKRKGGKRTFFLLAALAGVGVFVAKQMMGSKESTNWQSSYTPPPAPPAPPAPASPAAPMSGSHVADTSGAEATEGDAGGAAPGESLSDAVEAPHQVTTPDSPAETVDVADQDEPKA